MKAALRRLRAADAEAFRALRLEALSQEPAAFGAAFEEEARHAAAHFAAWLEAGLVLGAFAPDGTLLGMAGLRAETAAKRAHGIRRSLVAAVLEAARGRVTYLRLGMNAGNAPARRLYEAMGFRAHGTEPAALRVNGVDHDEVLMHLVLA